MIRSFGHLVHIITGMVLLASFFALVVVGAGVWSKLILVLYEYGWSLV